MECDFCIQLPHQHANFVVACVVCRQQFNCCRDCWRSAENNHYHCRPKKSGPLREIVADIQGRSVFPRETRERRERRDDDDIRYGAIAPCEWPELAVQVLVGPQKVFLSDASVELIEFGMVIDTDRFGMAYFGKIGLDQPTVRASKPGHVARDGSRFAVFSFPACGRTLTRNTIVTLWLDFTCEGCLTPRIKLANSKRMVSRAEIELAYKETASRRRSPGELFELLAKLKVEIDHSYKTSTTPEADLEKHKQALLDLEKFESEFQAFWESKDYDDVDHEEALNASIALLNTLLKPPRELSLQERAEECAERLQSILESLNNDIQGLPIEFEKKIIEERKQIPDWQQKIKDSLGKTYQATETERRGKQIKAAEERAKALMEDLKKKLASKKAEAVLVQEEINALTLALRSDQSTQVEKALLSCALLIKRHPVSGPPQSFAKPAILSNQLRLRTEMLKDLLSNGPIVIDTDCTRFNKVLHWQYYQLLCQMLSKGATIHDLMKCCDVWSRRSGAANDVSVVGVHEVDGAFVSSVCGITEVRIVPVEGGGFKFIGGGGMGEKVFAFGCNGALNFRSDFKKNEERFYAILLPQGFTFHFGHDIRCLGVIGASAREPSFKEFRACSFLDPAQGSKQTTVSVPRNKVFFIRSEESTAEGQMTIHFGFRQMKINGELISMVDFLRRHVLGVVEFDRSGAVLQYRLFKPE